MSLEILGHKTSEKEAAPDSMAGLWHCVLSGAAGAECDVVFTRDKKPIIWSNDMDSRLNLPLFKKIPDLTLKQVSKLKRTDCGEKVMLLGNIFKFLNVNPKFKIFFDVKFYFWDIEGHLFRPNSEIIELMVEEIVNPVRKRGLEHNIAFTTFLGGSELLKAVKRECPQIETNLITIFPWTDIEKHFFYLSSVTIGWNPINGFLWSLCDKRTRLLVKNAKFAGLKTYAGVANGERSVSWAMGNGFDAIWTDCVDDTRKIINYLNNSFD